MVLDMTITLGNILTALGVLTAGILAFSSMHSDLKLLTAQVQSMTEQLKGLSEVVTKLAIQETRLTAQDTRLNNIEKRIDELSRGRGFVMDAWSREPFGPSSKS